MTIWLGGMMISPLVAFMSSDKYSLEGKVLVGLAFATGSFSLGMLLNAFVCHGSWPTGNIYCPSTVQKMIVFGASTAGATCVAVILTVLRSSGRSRGQRLRLALVTVLAVPTFSPAALSIGPFLLLIWWGVLGWLMVKNPPLRMGDTTPPG